MVTLIGPVFLSATKEVAEFDETVSICVDTKGIWWNNTLLLRRRPLGESSNAVGTCLPSIVICPARYKIYALGEYRNLSGY